MKKPMNKAKKAKSAPKAKGIKKKEELILVKQDEKKQQMKTIDIKQKKEPKSKGRKSKQKKSIFSKPQTIQQQEKSQNNQKKLSRKYRTKSILQQLSNYSCQLLLDKKYKIKMHNNYEIDQKHELYDNITNLFALFVAKQKKKAEDMFIKTRYTYYPTFQFLLAGQKPEDNKCCICQFQFQQVKDIKQHEKQLTEMSGEDIVALRCSHLLHQNCLKMLIGDKEWFKCPVCSMIYGKMIGDQPNGSMTSTVHNDMHCDGYPDVGTIVIHYSMNSGKRGDISFPGTGRTAYLPNNIEGNQVLQLLRQAFNRKLIFTIGRSVTTGRDNQIVWNGVHHKTNTSGGSSHFGYPDDTYFDRVKLELAAKGIF